MKQKKIITTSIILIALIAIFLIPKSSSSQQTKSPNNEASSANPLQLLQNAGFWVLKQPAEPNDFTVSFLDSTKVNLSSYSGKAVILTYWATWCSTCQDVMPSMEKLYQQFHNQGLEILAVNLEEDADTVRQYIHNNGITFPVLLDIDGNVRAGYEIEGYPTNYILDREGNIIAMHTGALDWNSQDVIKAFDALLFAGISANVPDNSVLQQLTDAEKFALEYPLVGGDNIFVFRNTKEIVNILTNGTGIVFMGFKECPWCQLYALFLHDTAREKGISKIFYCDIKEDRDNNTENYQKILNILSGRLQFDDEGRQRLFVPDLTIIENGKILFRDFETSKNTLGYKTAQEYWNEERTYALKNRIKNGFDRLSESCNSCN